MRVNDLDRIAHPDFNDVLIHFTGRTGPSNRPVEIEVMSDWERLVSILRGGNLCGLEMPGAKARAVCFTEATSQGCTWLVNDGRYTSCGIAFSKRFLFGLGGGPVLQVRGDEWPEVFKWPETLRARAVRLWPGARPDGQETLPWWVSGRSEWLYEREWRVPTPEGILGFPLEEVAFLVLPSVELFKAWVRDVADDDPSLASSLASMRYIVFGAVGIAASNGVSQRHSSGPLLASRKD